MNLRAELRPSTMPHIEDLRAWMWHNTAGHIAIGLVPSEAAFRFHDRISEAMNVPHWL